MSNSDNLKQLIQHYSNDHKKWSLLHLLSVQNSFRERM